jgi:hypothetical protein
MSNFIILMIKFDKLESIQFDLIDGHFNQFNDKFDRIHQIDDQFNQIDEKFNQICSNQFDQFDE